VGVEFAHRRVQVGLDGLRAEAELSGDGGVACAYLLDQTQRLELTRGAADWRAGRRGGRSAEVVVDTGELFTQRGIVHGAGQCCQLVECAPGPVVGVSARCVL
jgi:hypothetical protein